MTWDQDAVPRHAERIAWRESGDEIHVFAADGESVHGVHAMSLRFLRDLLSARVYNQLDNTLLLFLQDNGACAETMGRQSNAEAVRKTSPSPKAPSCRPKPGSRTIGNLYQQVNGGLGRYQCRGPVTPMRCQTSSVTP